MYTSRTLVGSCGRWVANTSTFALTWASAVAFSRVARLRPLGIKRKYATTAASHREDICSLGLQRVSPSRKASTEEVIKFCILYARADAHTHAHIHKRNVTHAHTRTDVEIHIYTCICCQSPPTSTQMFSETYTRTRRDTHGTAATQSYLYVLTHAPFTSQSMRTCTSRCQVL